MRGFTRPRRDRLCRRSWWALTLVLCACKPQPHADKPHSVDAAAAELPAPPTVRDPFELDDEVVDPADALRAARHDCCDEQPVRPADMSGH